MSKHTPGPWKITRAKGLPHAIVAPHPEIGTIPVATVVIANDHEANASLLAAAPDMLAALQGLIAKSTDHNGDWSAEWHAALTAIAKATGA